MTYILLALALLFGIQSGVLYLVICDLQDTLEDLDTVNNAYSRTVKELYGIVEYERK